MSDTRVDGSPGWEPSHSVRLTSATALFMGPSGRSEDVCNVDVEVTVGDGSRWSATLLSLDEVTRLMRRWAETGEHLGGRFIQGDDLLITSEGGLDFLVGLLDDLVTTGEYRNVLQPLNPEWGGGG